MNSVPTIYLCDDEPDVLGAISFLLRQLDLEVRACTSGQELLATLDAAAKPLRGVIVLDLDMEPSGTWVHDQLIARGLGKRNPVIFLTGRGSIPVAVAAVAKGALNFVEKPHADDTFVALIKRALELEETWQKQARRCDFLHSMWDSLAPQQRRVALRVAAGNTNRVIGSDLGIVERTVEMTRSRVFEKLGVDSSAELATTLSDMRNCGIDTSAGKGTNTDPPAER